MRLDFGVVPRTKESDQTTYHPGFKYTQKIHGKFLQAEKKSTNVAHKQEQMTSIST
jgi:hypothetical protein